MPVLYHEKQESALCGQHCLNNLLQGPYFDAGALADIALELDRKEMELMMSQGMTDEARSFLKEQSGNVDEQGNFSVQVLSEAVQRMFKLTLEDARHEEVRPLMRDPAKLAEGFVINRHAHWLCMRKLDGQWWRINSSEEMPERVTEFALGANLAQLTQDGWSVFVVKGGKLPAQAPQYEGEARNWTDTSKPPAGAGWSMTGGNASSAPKFQAFTGAGQTLGGSSGGGGGGGGGGSEDEQLAQALAMSRGEAVKLRCARAAQGKENPRRPPRAPAPDTDADRTPGRDLAALPRPSLSGSSSACPPSPRRELPPRGSPSACPAARARSGASRPTYAGLRQDPPTPRQSRARLATHAIGPRVGTGVGAEPGGLCVRAARQGRQRGAELAALHARPAAAHRRLLRRGVGRRQVRRADRRVAQRRDVGGARGVRRGGSRRGPTKPGPMRLWCATRSSGCRRSAQFAQFPSAPLGGLCTSCGRLWSVADARCSTEAYPLTNTVLETQH